MPDAVRQVLLRAAATVATATGLWLGWSLLSDAPVQPYGPTASTTISLAARTDDEPTDDEPAGKTVGQLAEKPEQATNTQRENAEARGLLDPARALAVTVEERGDRPEEFRADDFIIGEFLTDQEFLVLAASEQGQGRVLVSQPMDGREDWYTIAGNLAEFLTRYYTALGDKWWEP